MSFQKDSFSVTYNTVCVWLKGQNAQKKLCFKKISVYVWTRPYTFGTGSFKLRGSRSQLSIDIQTLKFLVIGLFEL